MFPTKCRGTSLSVRKFGEIAAFAAQ